MGSTRLVRTRLVHHRLVRQRLVCKKLVVQSTEGPRTTDGPQSRNVRGHRSKEATARRIRRGEERRRAAEEVAEATTTTTTEATASTGQAQQWLQQEPVVPDVPATEPKADQQAAEEKKENKAEPVAPAPSVEQKKLRWSKF